MDLAEFIQKLKLIIKDLSDSNYDFERFEQDNILKEYIENELKVENLPTDNQIEAAYIRVMVLHLRRFLQRLPVRAEGGFWSFFVKRESRGELFRKVGECLMKFSQSLGAHVGQFEFSDKIESLNLSFANISIQQLQKIKNILNLERLDLSHIKIDGESLGILEERKFKDFLEVISSCKNLNSLNLSHNFLGDCSPSRLSELGKRISALDNLKELSLGSNNIKDRELLNFFKDTGFSVGKTFNGLDALDLSNNFIRLKEYSLDISGRYYDDLKYILDELSKRKIQVDLSANYINFLKANQQMLLDIFHKYPNLKSLPRQTESLINPAYLIDKKKGVVVIACEKNKNHASIFAHRMDDNGQLSLTKYHLTGNSGEGCCGVQVRIQQCDTDVFNSFFQKGTNTSPTFTFGEFCFVENDVIEKIHDNIVNDSVNTLDRELYKCLCNSGTQAINCYKYCLEILNRFLPQEKKLSEPFFLIPALDLTVRVEKTPERFCFPFFYNTVKPFLDEPISTLSLSSWVKYSFDDPADEKIKENIQACIDRIKKQGIQVNEKSKEMRSVKSSGGPKNTSHKRSIKLSFKVIDSAKKDEIINDFEKSLTDVIPAYDISSSSPIPNSTIS